MLFIIVFALAAGYLFLCVVAASVSDKKIEEEGENENGK